MRPLRIAAPLALLFALVAPAAGTAQGSTLAFSFYVTAEPGSELAFEAAWKAHMEFREANGDPWTWDVLQEAIGDNAGRYVIRSANHSWADLDAVNADESAQVLQSHFLTTVAPLARETSSAVFGLQESLSNLPPADPPMNVVAVTVFRIDAENQMAMQEALQEYHTAATEAGMYHAVLVPMIGGGDGPSILLAGFAENFAGLEEPSPSILETMTAQHGEERTQEIAQAFLAGIESARSYVLVRRPDLSSGGGM